MDKNEMAKRVTLREGLKVSVSIAQVKEVLRCFEDELREMPRWRRFRYILKMLRG
jgi:predicted DNA-binding antitoxin AbrB/MazE fold protein